MLAAPAPPAHITVDPARVLNTVSSAMYGACIEDVNHEIYGGLYAQRIFGESFEEPPAGGAPAGWQAFGGDWFPEDGGIQAREGAGPKLVWQGAAVADGTVEARVRLTHDMGENAGLLVRVTDPGTGADLFNGYEVSISAKHRHLVLGRHRHDFRMLQTVAAPVVPGRWHRLRVMLLGPRIRVYLDDEQDPRIDYTDTDAPLTGGKVALRTWHANASFREVRVNGGALALGFGGPGVSRAWDAVATGSARPRFALEGGAYNGSLCQKLSFMEGQGRVGVANRGLNRWGIAVRKGHGMEGRVYLRGDIPSAVVELQSSDGAVTYASQRVRVGPEWSRCAFRLKPDRTDPNARFVLAIDRPGALWADQAVLLDAPEDRFRGLPVRRDIGQQLAASGVTFMRYAGTMVNTPGYRWKSMIGDPDRRPPYAGHWYPVTTNGWGIFDFLNFCEKAGVRSAFAINTEETPEDAADLADYLTAPADSPWGRRRAADGHPEPYRPEYIEIGNEEGIGNTDPHAMEQYARRFRLLARAIHGRNPELKLVCAAWWVPEAPHMKTVFDAVDGEAAAWDFHFWCDSPDAGVEIDRQLDRAHELFHRWNPETKLKVVVFEENGNLHTMQRALGHAASVNATRRHGDFVVADCQANALQPWRQNDNGWDQGGVFFTPDHAWQMPNAQARALIAADHLPQRVEARSDSGVDVLATRSENGRRLALTLVNASDLPLQTRVSLGPFRPRSARATTLSGELKAATGPHGETPVAPAPLPVELSAGAASVTLPPHSVTSVRLDR